MSPTLLLPRTSKVAPNRWESMLSPTLEAWPTCKGLPLYGSRNVTVGSDGVPMS